MVQQGAPGRLPGPIKHYLLGFERALDGDVLIYWSSHGPADVFRSSPSARSRTQKGSPIDTTVIVGCGYLGKRVAALLHHAMSIPALAIVRREASARSLQEEGIQAVAMDLDSDLTFVPPPTDYRVLYLIPPPDTGSRDQRLRKFLEGLSAHPPLRMVYGGSSAVYGDCQGALVDESHPVSRHFPVAGRRLDAEEAVKHYAHTHRTSAVILRIAGIYGPGRLPLERLRAGRPVVRPSEAGVTNRIHVDDLARICLAALEHPSPEGCYNVADGHPTSTADFLRALAACAGLPPPPEVSLDTALKSASPAEARYLLESRRLDVTRMRRDLTPGWAPVVPSDIFRRDLGS